MASPENTGSIIPTEQVVFRNICIYNYMHAITIKKETEFQGELGEVYGKVQREER